jgi:hypothetical protein
MPKYKCYYDYFVGREDLSNAGLLEIEAESPKEAYEAYIEKIGSYPAAIHVNWGLFKGKYFEDHLKDFDKQKAELEQMMPPSLIVIGGSSAIAREIRPVTSGKKAEDEARRIEGKRKENANDGCIFLDVKKNDGYLKFFCSSCGQKLGLPDDFEKDSIFCPSCGVSTQVPLGLRDNEQKEIPPSADDNDSALAQVKISSVNTKVPTCIYVIGVIKILIGFCGGVSYPSNWLMQNFHFMDIFGMIISILSFYYGICLIMLKENSRLNMIDLLNAEQVLAIIGCVYVVVFFTDGFEGLNNNEIWTIKLLSVLSSGSIILINNLLKHFLKKHEVAKVFINETN